MGQRFVLGVDLDGVVGDFYEFMRHVAAEWLGVPVDDLTPEVNYGLPEWGIKPEQYSEMHRFAVTQRGLFRKMQVIPGAAPALRRLSDADIHIRIITHRLFIPHFHREAVQQTVDWLDNYGIPYRDLCFTGEKVAVGADMYVDDTPQNVEALRKGTEAPTIVFTNSTNRDVADPRADDWEQVEQLVLEERERWRERQEPDQAVTGR
jgi:5'(3')-deoxyribonucleotidase